MVTFQAPGKLDVQSVTLPLHNAVTDYSKTQEVVLYAMTGVLLMLVM